MQVSADIKRRVDAKIAECITKINAAHGVSMTTPTVRYDINSTRLGGEAIPGQNIVRFNPVFLNAHTDEYIEQVVPHEIAHIGVRKVYGIIRHGKKYSSHGPEWQNMMVVTLGVPAKRTHSMVAEGVQHGRQKSKYVYRCPHCNSDLVVGPKHHRALQTGHHLRHKSCGYVGTFQLQRAAGKVSYEAARATPAAPAAATPQRQAPAAPNVKAPTPGSKLALCYAWFKRCMDAGRDRKYTLRVFEYEAGMTPAGASTYYSQCQKLYDAQV
jgi:SprT protein